MIVGSHLERKGLEMEGQEVGRLHFLKTNGACSFYSRCLLASLGAFAIARSLVTV